VPFCLLLDLPDDAAHLGTVRHVAADLLRSFAVSTQDIDDIEALVGEIATNAVRHAQSHGGYRLVLELTDDSAVITVSDTGVGFSRACVAAPGTLRPDPNGDERVGGWGLPLVELLADHVEYVPQEPRGTTIRALKRLQTVGHANQS
jgi:anti-sigma regulatory factor (Ser/Thr protein kinase)